MHEFIEYSILNWFSSTAADIIAFRGSKKGCTDPEGKWNNDYQAVYTAILICSDNLALSEDNECDESQSMISTSEQSSTLHHSYKLAQTTAIYITWLDTNNTKLVIESWYWWLDFSKKTADIISQDLKKLSVRNILFSTIMQVRLANYIAHTLIIGGCRI